MILPRCPVCGSVTAQSLTELNGPLIGWRCVLGCVMPQCDTMPQVAARANNEDDAINEAHKLWEKVGRT